MPSFDILWDNYPRGTPCLNAEGNRPSYAGNQCAIKLGTCFLNAGLDLKKYRMREHKDNDVNTMAFCWEEGHEEKQHILRAQELASFLKVNFREPEYLKGETVTKYSGHLNGKNGIVFFSKLLGHQQPR